MKRKATTEPKARRVTVRLDPKLFQRLRLAMAGEGWPTFSDALRAAVESWCNARGAT